MIKYRLLFVIILLFIICNNCNKNDAEKIQKQRSNVINLSNNIVDIEIEELFGKSMLYILDDLLIINEISPKGEKGIHLYDKNTFRYITSTGFIGRGPGEIIVPGRIGLDKRNRILWAPDHGSRVLYKFPIDSILMNPMFKPTVKKDFKEELFIDRFGFLNDSIMLGKGVKITSASTFEMAMAKQNININVIEQFGYEHPEMTGQKSNSFFSMSVENNFYVNCYSRSDLITICDLNGNLKYNIYGPEWVNNDDKKAYFADVDICSKFIIASYIGINRLNVQGNISRGNSPTKFMIFDFEGNYISTIETGNEFTKFCIDEENKRIIMNFIDKEEALGYIDLAFLF